MPAINAIIPGTIAAGSGNTTMEVVGANVDDSTVVLWNGSPLSTTLVSDSTVSSQVESASIAVPATVQVQLMNKITGSKSSPFALSIGSAAKASSSAITTTSLPNGTVGTSYSASLTATGGTPSYTWQLTSGRVPAGLTMTATGNISGTPAIAGTYSLGLTVTDKSRPAQAKFIALTIIIAPKPVSVTPVSISTTSLPSASFDAAYSQTLQASGGSGIYSWSVASGGLPSGLTLSHAGVVSGTPTASGNFSFTVSVSDTSTPAQSSTASLNISVAAAPIRIGTTSLAAGTVGSAYSHTLSVSGGTPGYSWSLASGSLPAGLTLNASGVISGTPSAPGPASFVATVHDSGNPAQTASVSLSVSIAAPALSITSARPAPGTFGRPYSASLQATGGTPGYSWSIASGSLPAGLSLNGTTGVISGTALSGGTASFTAAVRDSGSPTQTASSPMTITISAAPLAITAATLASANVGTSYSQTLQATGGTAPYHWSITSGQLPAGLRLSTSGTISGTPTTAGTAMFTATATDSSNPTQTASLVMSILVNPAKSTLASATPLSILAPAAASGTVGAAFNQSLGATGGTNPDTWSIQSGSLPVGLTLAAGVISGTPAAGSKGSYNVTIAVTDSESPAQTATSTMSITIAAAVTATPLSIQSSTLVSGTAGMAYNQSLQATGGSAPYTWSLTSGSLPAGLNLSTAGTISGTPKASGTSTFSVTATDSSSPAQTQTASLSISIAATQSSGGTTWFVRQDGGTLYNAKTNPTGQCNGQADAAYPGSGTNQPCAVNHPQLLWLNGAYGVSSWSTSGFSGGDTLVIRSCALQQGQTGTANGQCLIGPPNGSNSGSYCNGITTSWGCGPPPPPSGTSGHPTIIESGCAYDSDCTPVRGYPYSGNLTQLWGAYAQPNIFQLTGGVSYVNILGFELTTHNGVCTHAVGSPAYPRTCNTSAPGDPYAYEAIGTDNQTANINLTNLYIHGFNSSGIAGPIGGTVTLNNVIIAFNAFAGWNMDDGSSTPNAPGSQLLQSYVTMIGNGCLEEYPIVHTQFPALACWDINHGGFGDSWSGQNTNLAKFTCDHCTVAYNVKDGGLGPHTLIHQMSITNSTWVGQAGSNHKWGQDANASLLFQNNTSIANCNRWTTTLPGASQSFYIGSGLGGAYVGSTGAGATSCRIGGSTDGFAYFAGAGSNVLFAGNTFVWTQPTGFDLSCQSGTGMCASTPYQFTDNIQIGYTTSQSAFPYSGEAPGLYYTGGDTLDIIGSHNDEYGIRNGDTCGSNGNICADPLLTSEPAQGAWPSESALDNFNFHPTAGSPVSQAGASLSGLTSDYYGVTRLNPPSIGAVEP